MVTDVLYVLWMRFLWQLQHLQLQKNKGLVASGNASHTDGHHNRRNNCKQFIVIKSLSLQRFFTPPERSTCDFCHMGALYQCKHLEAVHQCCQILREKKASGPMKTSDFCGKKEKKKKREIIRLCKLTNITLNPEILLYLLLFLYFFVLVPGLQNNVICYTTGR